MVRRRMGGVRGVPPGDVLILGSGVVATNAAQIAIGFGANVIMAGENMDQLRQAGARFGSAANRRCHSL